MGKLSITELKQSTVRAIEGRECVYDNDGQNVDVIALMLTQIENEASVTKATAKAVLYRGLLDMKQKADHSVDFSAEDIFNILNDYELVRVKGQVDANTEEYQLHLKAKTQPSIRTATLIDANLYLYQHYYAKQRYITNNRQKYLSHECQALASGTPTYGNLTDYRGDFHAVSSFIEHMEKYAHSSRSNSYLDKLRQYVIKHQLGMGHQATRENHALNKTLAQMHRDLDNSQHALTAMTKDRDRAREGKRRFLANATENYHQVVSLRQENEHLQTMVSNKDVVADRLQAHLSPAQQIDFESIGKYEKRIAELSKNVDDSKRKIKLLENDNGKFSRENAQLKEENSWLKSSVEALRTLMVKLIKLIPNAKSKPFVDEYEQALAKPKNKGTKAGITRFINNTLLGKSGNSQESCLPIQLDPVKKAHEKGVRTVL